MAFSIRRPSKLELALVLLIILAVFHLCSGRQNGNEETPPSLASVPQDSEVSPSDSRQPSQDISSTSLNSRFRGTVPSPLDRSSLVSLDSLLDQTANLYGLEIRNTLGIRLEVESVPLYSGATETLRDLADRLGLALAGNLNGLQDGSCTQVHVTAGVIYAGSDTKVLGMLEGLAAPSPEERANIIDEISDYGLLNESAGLEPVVTRALIYDINEEVRVAAARGLEEAVEPKSIDALISALSDRSEEVREHARTTLGLIGGDDVLEKLREERNQVTDLDARDIIDQILEQVFNEPLNIDPY